jgi:hypothetical protein
MWHKLQLSSGLAVFVIPAFSQFPSIPQIEMRAVFNRTNMMPTTPKQMTTQLFTDKRGTKLEHTTYLLPGLNRKERQFPSTQLGSKH